MNPLYILLGFSITVIFSYLFDAFARKTKFPSVLLLILLGILARYILDYLGYNIPNLEQLIPTLGTIGLIFIVLEGALELEISKEKYSVIVKSFLAATIVLLLSTFCIYYMLDYLTNLTDLENLLMAIPFAVISSAVAIPSSNSLPTKIKEFIIYESTFSDILGIVFFNFVMNHYNEGKTSFNYSSLLDLFTQIFLVVIMAFFVTFVLFKMIEKLKTKIKFFLILSVLILSYALGKLNHLSALIIVFIFGLFMNNSKTLLPNFITKNTNTELAEKDLYDFHVLTAETTFLTRTFFFLFFGFSIELSIFSDYRVYYYGILFLGVMIVARSLYFGIFHYNEFSPTSFIAPRGLISILLFTQIPESFTKNGIIDQNELLIVILGSMVWMLIGIVLFSNKSNLDVEQNPSSE